MHGSRQPPTFCLCARRSQHPVSIRYAQETSLTRPLRTNPQNSVHRDYLRGACPSAKLCKFPHPPFAMATPSPPAHLAGRSNVLCVDPEAVQRAQQVGYVMP